MRLLLPILFVLVAVGGLFGLLFFQQTMKGDSETGALKGVFSSIVEDIGGQFSNKPKPAGEGFAIYLPEAADGWEHRPFELADAETLVEDTYRSSNAAISTNNTRMGFLVAAAREASAAAITYFKDDLVVLVGMRSRSGRDMRSLQGSIMTAIAGNIAQIDGWEKNDFATIDGIKVTLREAISKDAATRSERPVRYRTFTAGMGGQVSIQILTNASDADLANVLKGMDIQGLNETLEVPDPNVTPGTGLVTRLENELSTVPPRPSIAYQAYTLLRANAELTAADVRMLQIMTEGELLGWDDLLDEFGVLEGYSPIVMEILGERPPETISQIVQRRAIAHLRLRSDWSDHDERILTRIKTGSLQERGEIRYYFDENKSYAEDVLELLALLPEVVEEVADENSGSLEQQLVVRRGIGKNQNSTLGGDCVIELGIRKCSLADE